MNRQEAAEFIRKHIKDRQPFEFPSNKEYSAVRLRLLDMCEYLVNAYAVGHEDAREVYEWLYKEIERLDLMYPEEVTNGRH